MLNKDILEVKCTSKVEYDSLIEDYKAKGYYIIERGSSADDEWYFKCYNTK